MRPALTHLSEDELAFRQAVRDFAEAEILPLRSDMDQKAEMSPASDPLLLSERA